jgi:two-component system, NarL family, response regulator LiaR
MKRTLLLYGLCMALLVFLLKILEYRLWIRELSIAHYVGIVAVFFTLLGGWAGWKLTKVRSLKSDLGVTPDVETILRNKGISKREFEVLALMARGHSNQEIADALFISLNTVKTHSSNLFLKLEAKRRTQAIEHAKREGLIP